MNPISLFRDLRRRLRKPANQDQDTFDSVVNFDAIAAGRLLKGGRSETAGSLADLANSQDISGAIEFMPHIVDSAKALENTTADRLIELRFTLSAEPEVQFDDEIDWNFDPTSDPSRRWAKALNRHQWLVLIAEAYRDTGEERYVNAAGEIWRHWIKNNPPPGSRNEQNVAWTLMGVGIRAMIWPDALLIFSRSKNFRELVAPQVLLSLHDHAEFLTQNKTHLNHLLREANGLLHIALRYPEFRAAEQWMKTAVARLSHEIDIQVQNDGSHIEASPAYQWLVVEELTSTTQICNLAPDNEALIELQSTVYRGLANLSRYLSKIATPANTWPQIKEGFYPPQAQLRYMLLQTTNRSNDEHARWVATEGTAGKPSEETNAFFPDSGTTVFREKWSSDSHYLIFQNGVFGGAHGHEDALGIELWAGGTAFLIDPGTSSYNKNDPFRHYFTSSNAHNTVVVDGMSQVRRWSRDHWWSKPTALGNSYEDNLYKNDEDICWSAGVYSGRYAPYKTMRGNYKRAKQGITHRRQVLFIRNHYWVLVDDLSSPKASVFERLFQCAPEVDVHQTARGVTLTKLGTDQRLFVSPAERDQVTYAKGELEPIAGWACDGTRNTRYPAPQLSIKSTAAKRTRLVTLLMPIAGLNNPQEKEPSVEIETGSTEGDLLRVTYYLENRVCTDEIALHSAFGPPRLV